jgi:hypothetical protein
MKIIRAVIAGVLGALVMSFAMWILRLGGVDVNLEALLGSMLVSGDRASAWMAGFLLHLAVGGVAGLVYAGVFEMAVQRSGLVLGAGLGICHGLLAGLMMSGIPAMNPLALGTQAAPGPFLQNLAYGPFVFLLLHGLFGAVVGLVYGPTVQHAHQYTNRTA